MTTTSRCSTSAFCFQKLFAQVVFGLLFLYTTTALGQSRPPYLYQAERIATDDVVAMIGFLPQEFKKSNLHAELEKSMLLPIFDIQWRQLLRFGIRLERAESLVVAIRKFESDQVIDRLKLYNRPESFGDHFLTVHVRFLSDRDGIAFFREYKKRAKWKQVWGRHVQMRQEGPHLILARKINKREYFITTEPVYKKILSKGGRNADLQKAIRAIKDPKMSFVIVQNDRVQSGVEGLCRMLSHGRDDLIQAFKNSHLFAASHSNERDEPLQIRFFSKNAVQHKKVSRAMRHYLREHAGPKIAVYPGKANREQEIETNSKSLLADMIFAAKPSYGKKVTKIGWSKKLPRIALNTNGDKMATEPKEPAKPERATEARKGPGKLSPQFVKFAKSQGWRVEHQPLEWGYRVHMNKMPSHEALFVLGDCGGDVFLTSDFDWNDAFVKALGGFENIKAIWFNSGSVTDSGMRTLSHYKHLRYISIIGSQDSKITDAGVKELARLPNLESFGIHFQKFRGDAFRSFRNSKLKQIKIGSVTEFGDSGLVALKNIKSLEDLELKVTFAEGTDVSTGLVRLIRSNLPPRFVFDAKYMDDEVFLALLKKNWFFGKPRYEKDPKPKTAAEVKRLWLTSSPLTD